MSTRAFLRRLTPVLVVALGLRLVYSLLIVKTRPLLGDGLEFHTLAHSIADAQRYAQASFLTPDDIRPTADKPPLYPLVLSVFTLIGGHGWIPHHVAGALIGTGTVAVIALLGRRVAGPTAGLIAGGLAAVYPMLIAADGSYRSESLYALLIASTLLAAYALRDSPTARRAALCGVLVGLATLTRGEALLLLGLVVFPAALLAVPRRRALALTAVAGAVAVAVLTPWLVRCWVQFDRPVYVSTNSGGLLAGANCEKTYHGEWLGQWRFDCLAPPKTTNEAEASAALAADGIEYAREHAGRLPVVLTVRLLRSWELYRPRQQWTIEHFFEGRDLRVQQLGVAMYFLLVALALAGARRLRARAEPLRVLAAPFVLVVIVSLTAYGFTRFRIAAEPALVVLAAVTLAALWERRAGSRAAPRAPAPAG